MIIYPNLFATVSLPRIPLTNSLTAIHKKLFNYSHCVWLCEVCLITQGLLESFLIVRANNNSNFQFNVKLLRITSYCDSQATNQTLALEVWQNSVKDIHVRFTFLCNYGATVAV